jgi:hypothetical protein
LRVWTCEEWDDHPDDERDLILLVRAILRFRLPPYIARTSFSTSNSSAFIQIQGAYLFQFSLLGSGVGFVFDLDGRLRGGYSGDFIRGINRRNVNGPDFLNTWRARPEYAIVPESELSEILGVDLSLASIEEMTPAGKDMFAYLTRMYTRDNIEGSGNAEAANDDDERRWVVVFSESRLVNFNNAVAAEFFWAKYARGNIPVVFVIVPPSTHHARTLNRCSCRAFSRPRVRRDKRMKRREKKGSHKMRAATINPANM